MFEVQNFMKRWEHTLKKYLGFGMPPFKSSKQLKLGNQAKHYKIKIWCNKFYNKIFQQAFVT